MLSDLSAKNIEVHCTGGLDLQLKTKMNAHVEVKFKSLRPAVRGALESTEAKYNHIKLKGLDNCALMYQVFDKLKNSFSIQNIKKHQACFKADGPYFIELDVLE